jgi:hypothetical protein
MMLQALQKSIERIFPAGSSLLGLHKTFLANPTVPRPLSPLLCLTAVPAIQAGSSFTQSVRYPC